MRGLDRVDAQMGALVVIWGSAFLGIKALGHVLDPYQMTWYRYALFPLLYGGYLATRRRATFALVTGRDWVLMAVLGFFGVIGYHFALNWGLHADAHDSTAVSGATGSILIATNPLWTLLLAVALGRERFRKAALAGFALAFVGVSVVVLWGKSGSHAGLDQAQVVKAAVILLAPMSWALYSVFSKPLIARYGGLFVTGVTLSLGTFMLLPLGVTYGLAPLAALGAGEWFWLAFLALLSTAAGYAIWNDALKHRKASDVAVFVYAQPVVTALLGSVPVLIPSLSFIPKEPITPFFALGAAMVLAGVVWVNQVRLRPEIRSQSP